ncbi:MAG: dehydrogenase [Planctomycetaceae bacterium]|nr:dehydrogenase [Planctomycetaceae bacterium]
MQNTGVAIIGTGFMGWVHVEALRRCNRPIVGILGSSPGKSREAAETLQIEKAYEDLRQLLADEDVTSVHIATPNRLHFPMVKACLEAGKHVMCEKPLAMNSKESAELVELSVAYPKLAAGVNYNIRFYPLCMETREMISTGALGEVLHITGSYTQDWLSKQTDYNWRVLADEGGELRAVADIGTHWFDLITSLSGLEIEAVCADLKTVYDVRRRPVGEVATFSGSSETEKQLQDVLINTEDYGAILLKFKGGARGSVFVSQVMPGRKNCLQFEIAGSKSTLSWNSEQGNEIWIGHRDRPNERLIRDPALLSSAAATVASYPGGHNEGYADSFKQSFRSFYGYIGQNDWQAVPPYATFADGHREVALCEAILASHQNQSWVTVGE